jgi:tetratricopeptide (TPR) repeat protein
VAAWQNTQVSAVELLDNGQKAEADGAIAEALDWYLRAVEVDPQLVAAWEGAGLIYEEEADWPAAIAVYEEAIASVPRNSDLLYHLGRVIGQATWPTDWATILQLADRAITNNAFLQDWNSRQTHLMRADALRGLGRHLEALNEYQWVLARYPDDYWASLGRADTTWQALGDVPGAEKLFLAAIASNPDNKWGYRELAEFYATLGRIDEARALYERVLQLDPGDNAATKWLAQN